MTAATRSRYTLTMLTAIGILAGCGGGNVSPIGSSGLPAAQSAIPGMPGMRNVIPHRLDKTSVITVKMNGRPVPDAEVKMGWGQNCGLLGCHPYQKTGKTGPMGTKEYKGLPSGRVYYCIAARKGFAYAERCAGPFFVDPKESISLSQ
jgi:hypothetical protein